MEFKIQGAFLNYSMYKTVTNPNFLKIVSLALSTILFAIGASALLYHFMPRIAGITCTVLGSVGILALIVVLARQSISMNKRTKGYERIG